MDELVILFAACVATFTALTAWMIARTGALVKPEYETQGVMLALMVVSLIGGVVALAVRQDGVMALVGVIFALAGAGAGGSVGWLTRDPIDRRQR